MAKTKKQTKPKSKKITAKAKKPSTKEVAATKNPDVMSVGTSDPKTSAMSPRILAGALVLAAVFVVLYMLRGSLVVAVVNGQPVWRWEVISRIEQTQGQEYMESIITSFRDIFPIS